MWGKMERGSDGSVVKVGVDPKLRVEVLAEFGQMSCGELLLKRVKYLTDGAVLGGKAFVEGIFGDMKDRYRRRKRGQSRRPGRAAGLRVAIPQMGADCAC